MINNCLEIEEMLDAIRKNGSGVGIGKVEPTCCEAVRQFEPDWYQVWIIPDYKYHGPYLEIYSGWVICNCTTLEDAENFCKKHNLPVLERKLGGKKSK